MISYLELGDWSDDGHGKTKVLMVEHNNGVNLWEAYKNGCERMGFVFDRHVACDYEEHTISRGYKKMMEDAGINVNAEVEPPYDFKGTGEPDEYVISDWTDGYARLWMEVARLGTENPSKFQYTIKELDTIHAGGYGLFV